MGKVRHKDGGGDGGGGGGGGGGAGGSGSGSGREAEGHTSPGGRFWPAPQWEAGELPTPKPTDRHDNLRPTSGLEIQLAKHIVATKERELLEEGAPTMQTDVPAVDLPSVVEQMRRERERFRARDGMGSYQELARYEG